MSTIPAVLAQLSTTTWAGITGLQVEDGPTSRDLRGDALLVGFTPDEVPLSAVEQIADLGNGAAESYTVASVVRCWTGGDSFNPIRVRAYEHLSTMRARLRADPTLGGVVTRARFAGHVFQQYRNDKGQLVVDLVVQVAVDSLK